MMPSTKQTPATVSATRRKSGGRTPKDKGNREERLLVNFLQGHGFGA